MKLQPINQQETITFSNTTTFNKPSLKRVKKVQLDPEEIIPSGVFGVIKWEMGRQLVTAILSAILLLACSIIIIMQVEVWKSGPMMYIPPTVFGLIGLYKFSMSLIESNEIKKSIKIYRQDIKVGLTSTPPFISKLFINFHKKQIAHNWITFSMIFYGGISVLLLWWLKDVNWWIFDFKLWIQKWMGNPTLIASLMSASLLVIVVIHIAFAIMRRKRISDMNMYFGQGMATQSEIEEIKTNKNKFYRRLFLISLLVLLVIPMIVRITWKIIKRKR